VVIEKPEIEAYSEDALSGKTDVATSPIPFLEDKIDDTEAQACVPSSESKSTQTAEKSVTNSGCMTANGTQSTEQNKTSSLVCKSCGGATNSYSSIKFYTSLALAGLFAIFFAVTQFSPDIHKTYSRPPPI